MIQVKRASMLMFVICLIGFFFSIHQPTFADEKQRVFDDAQLLIDEEVIELEQIAMEYSEKLETDFIVLTLDEGLDIDYLSEYIVEMYEEHDYGYDQLQGNAAILAVDASSRNVYIAGFADAEMYLDDGTIEYVLDEIVDSLSNDEFADAFEQFIVTAAQEMDDAIELEQNENEAEMRKRQEHLVNFAKDSPEMRVFDQANILSSEEKESLEIVAKQYSKESETDFITLLIDYGFDQYELIQYIEDMYELNGFGFDKKHGNAVVMALDVNSREVYIAGYYKAERLLDNDRIELVLDDIIDYLGQNDFNKSAEQYVKSASRYMGYKEGIQPNSIFLQPLFQLVSALIIACLIVGLMIYHSGGRKTTTDKTYRNEKTTRVTDRSDTYIRTSLTKVRKPSDNNNNGGGGGTSSGGHSHSGGGRSF